MANCLETEECGLFRILNVLHRLSHNFVLIEVLEKVIEAAQNVLDADRGTVFLYDARQDELYSRVASGEGEIRFPVSAGIAGDCARTRRLMNVQDCYSDSRFNPEIDRKTGYKTRCLMAIPLIGIKDELVGVLEVLNKRGGVFDRGDERLGELLAAQCAVALQRASLVEEYMVKQKLEQDLALARDIQHRVLPKDLPSLPGYDFSCWSRSADATGGDIYDAVSLSDIQAAVLMADATGHGIGPALMVTQMRAMFRLGLRMNSDLGLIMSQINDQLKQDLPEDHFITAFLGIIDSVDHRLHYYSCGQAPILHYHASNSEVESLNASSLPMGIMSGITMPAPPPIKLEPGDIVSVISDGFFEYRDSNGNEFGTERVNEIIAANSSRTMEELIKILIAAIEKFAPDKPQDDDMTAVLFCRRR